MILKAVIRASSRLDALAALEAYLRQHDADVEFGNVTIEREVDTWGAYLTPKKPIKVEYVARWER